MAARMWSYMLDGSCIMRVKRPDSDMPYVGMPIDIVGRHGIPAPVEEFVVTAVDANSAVISLAELHER